MVQSISPSQPKALVPTATWRYDERGWTRDLRIDFLRGFVFLLLFTAHFEFFSWFSLIAWERLGVVSSAEVFILLAGVVTGAVYGKKLRSEGLKTCTLKLGKRAWTLYKIALIVSGSIALLRYVPGLDTKELSSFTDPVAGTVFPLFPDLNLPWTKQLGDVVTLRATPHQFQIVGLYVVLFLLTPIVFWAIYNRMALLLVAVSWAAYLYNFFTPESQPGTAEIRLTWLQFEYAFPSIAWQLLFVHGILLGYYRKGVVAFFSKPVGKVLVWACILLAALLMFFSLNHPLDKLPDWARLEFIPPDTFRQIYSAWFAKYKLAPGRLLNIVVLMVAMYALLTFAWKPIYRALGWLFIPMGQETMYVFFVHIYLILLVANLAYVEESAVWVNTLLHATMLLLTWVMVKARFLFRWIPH